MTTALAEQYAEDLERRGRPPAGRGRPRPARWRRGADHRSRAARGRDAGPQAPGYPEVPSAHPGAPDRAPRELGPAGSSTLARAGRRSRCSRPLPRCCPAFAGLVLEAATNSVGSVSRGHRATTDPGRPPASAAAPRPEMSRPVAASSRYPSGSSSTSTASAMWATITSDTLSSGRRPAGTGGEGPRHVAARLFERQGVAVERRHQAEVVQQRRHVEQLGVEGDPLRGAQGCGPDVRPHAVVEQRWGAVLRGELGRTARDQLESGSATSAAPARPVSCSASVSSAGVVSASASRGSMRSSLARLVGRRLRRPDRCGAR